MLLFQQIFKYQYSWSTLSHTAPKRSEEITTIIEDVSESFYIIIMFLKLILILVTLGLMNICHKNMNKLKEHRLVDR